MESSVEQESIYNRVEAALDAIRPYLEADGGNLRIVEITEGLVVNVELLGSCESCPMSSMTMKAGIEQAIINAVPEVKAVQATNITPLSK